MCFVPDTFACECPWCSDADEVVSLGMVAEDAQVVEDDAEADGKHKVWMYFDAEIPENSKYIRGEQKGEDEKDERVVLCSEAFNVFLFGVDAGNELEDEVHGEHDERY